MSKWEPGTLREHLEVNAPEQIHQETICPGIPAHRCGRKVTPKMMRSTRGMGSVLVGKAIFICDACEEWLRNTGKLDRATAASKRGAPKTHVAWLQKRDGNHD